MSTRTTRRRTRRDHTLPILAATAATIVITAEHAWPWIIAFAAASWTLFCAARLASGHYRRASRRTPPGRRLARPATCTANRSMQCAGPIGYEHRWCPIPRTCTCTCGHPGIRPTPGHPELNAPPF